MKDFISSTWQLAASQRRVKRTVSTPVLAKLLKGGADVNQKAKDGTTPLGRSLSVGQNLHVVRMLIANGANLYEKSVYDKTPLQLSLELPNDYKDIAEKIIEGGADVNEKCGPHNRTVLHDVVRYWHGEETQEHG